MVISVFMLVNCYANIDGSIPHLGNINILFYVTSLLSIICLVCLFCSVIPVSPVCSSLARFQEFWV